jgi:hypothetical protein
MFGTGRKHSKDNPSTEEQSLEEFFASLDPCFQSTSEEVRAQAHARTARIRKSLLLRYGVTEENLLSAPEPTRTAIGAELMHELAHSPEAKAERSALEIALAQEKFQELKLRTERILAHHRSRPSDAVSPTRASQFLPPGWPHAHSLMKRRARAVQKPSA